MNTNKNFDLQCTEKINGVHILEPKCKVNHVPKPTIMDDPVDFILSPTYNASSTPWCRVRKIPYLTHLLIIFIYFY